MSFAKQFRLGRLREALRSGLLKSLPAVVSFLERSFCLRMALIVCGLGILVFSIPSRAMESAQDTLYRGFLDPPRQYSPMPFWFWNGKMEGPKIQEQIGKMVGQHVFTAPFCMASTGSRPLSFGRMVASHWGGTGVIQTTRIQAELYR
ncbi:MAG: hypothetical protein U0V70_15445 [Terriglobia bacterium]